MSTANFKGISQIHDNKDETDLSDINISNLNHTQQRKSDHKSSGKKSNYSGHALEINLDLLKHKPADEREPVTSNTNRGLYHKYNSSNTYNT